MIRPTTAPPLALLLTSIARRDQKALSALYDASSRWVYGLVFRMLGDTQAAEEVTMDVYMQVWRRAATYEPDRGSPGAWLLALARNRAIDRLRSRALRRRHEEAFAEGFDAAWKGSGPEALNASDERRRRILAAMDSLPPEQREAIDLAFFQGLTHTEVSARLGHPVGTIKTRIRLGMLKLRSLLKPFEDLS